VKYRRGDHHPAAKAEEKERKSLEWFLTKVNRMAPNPVAKQLIIPVRVPINEGLLFDMIPILTVFGKCIKNAKIAA